MRACWHRPTNCSTTSRCRSCAPRTCGCTTSRGAPTSTPTTTFRSWVTATRRWWSLSHARPPRSTPIPATWRSSPCSSPRSSWRRCPHSSRASYSPAPAARPTISRCASARRPPAAAASSSPSLPTTAPPTSSPGCRPRTAARWDRACTPCLRRSARPAPRRSGRRCGVVCGACAPTVCARRHCWSTRSLPATAWPRIRPGSSPRPRGRCARRARCSSPTRSNRASAGLVRRCGAFSATASSPTSLPWVNPWATGTRSPPWPGSRVCWPHSRSAPAISTPTGATACRAPRRWPCCRSSASSSC